MSVPVAPWRTLRAAQELLRDRADHERAEREAEPERPDAHAERQRAPPPVDDAADDRPQELIDAGSTIVDLRHASSGPMPVSSSSISPIGTIHLLKNGGPTVRRSPRDRLAQRREHRREQDEERREQQDPVVDQERRFARHPRIELVARRAAAAAGRSPGRS